MASITDKIRFINTEFATRLTIETFDSGRISVMANGRAREGETLEECLAQILSDILKDKISFRDQTQEEIDQIQKIMDS